MNVNVRSLAVRIVGLFVVFALALFLPAGTTAWFTGWVFLVLFFGFVVALTRWLLRTNPGLLQERLVGLKAADRKVWDRALIQLTGVLFLGWLVLMPLDAVRFHWSLMPVWLQVAGAIALAGSFCLFYLTFRENPYLSPAVRIQHDRGQTVISTGPYHYVRHPMYSAFVVLVVATPLLLGSYWGLLGGLMLVTVVARRAVLEERALQEELQGYDAYMTRVRYHLFPGVW